ncbi:nitrite and sulphite reductase 4Fe-4S domain protein [Desulfosporosinus sp. OT]|uniref:nitrite and sulphite reductase 4Fe-4S domain protein n=1 Tax=Desulfosporosinus sp. OT TaxID=913865 RepID=UPI000223AAE3|nr:nitrite and sulphite reductase 4Fe-4S domain protein [Desulfosporosinus sp. OT]EGW37626.1 nitrite and sulphite reductase 4Fe-4S domain protein [Desulfosporosinus sp. OT]
MELTDAQKKSLKGQGYIAYKDGVHFSCRVVIPAGRMNAQQARKITDVCEKYGKGSFSLTQRLNVEIPWIQYQDLDNVKRELMEVGLSIGGTGMRPRPALACKGSVCQMSFFDTEEVAKMIDERFYKGQYDQALPNKLRIIVSGCGNGCSKPRLGCIGLQGRKSDQVAISLGGKFGKEQSIGRELPGLYSINEALDICEKAIAYYRENGIQGERLAKTIERIGFETVGSALTGLALSEFNNL